MSNIIESLRNISRESESDAFERCGIADIINDVQNLSKERYHLKGVLLDVDYAENCKDMFIECQRLQISQILINLLNNAFDAVQDEKEKWIKVTISDTESNAMIAVTDSGKGIKKDVLARIFEPMFTTKEIGKGTGLGLSISSGIAKNHNGSLSYDEPVKTHGLY